MKGPAFLYLHGFASSAASTKARAFVEWGKARGVDVHALDLRVPSFQRLLFSAIVARVREAIDAAGGPRARVALIGSSLGGLTACRVAEQDPRVCAVFAMAPAFRLVERWKATIGDAEWEKWRSEGFREVDDHLTEAKAKVHFGFASELESIDVGYPDVRVPVCIVQPGTPRSPRSRSSTSSDPANSAGKCDTSVWSRSTTGTSSSFRFRASSRKQRPSSPRSESRRSTLDASH